MLENQLGQILPLVNEANLISAELGRAITFSVKMVRHMPDGGQLQGSQTEVLVRFDNKEDGWWGLWNADKFESRVQMMREILSQYFDTEVRPEFENKDKDPWWDPVEPILVGTSYLGLRPICYAMGSEEVTSKILHSEGIQGQNGLLVTEFDCTDREGNIDEDLYQDVEEREDLVGKELTFKIDIKWVKSLPEDLCTNPFVTYTLQYESDLINTTPEQHG